MRLLYFVKIITFKILFPTGKVMFLIFFIYKRDPHCLRISHCQLCLRTGFANALPFAMIYV